ncbi:hypothetical protein ARMSODRAFT_1027664 [Armillaria solidipes]|uniref:Uncharacterized protein n=1 Tax=Armillaria solidipes TaxID=1076256 RepID=A0A2H3B3I8_9AGAR|nr:hypothetical protein ARMSODRAFT_1027664 [Armillaria solidipes]
MRKDTIRISSVANSRPRLYPEKAGGIISPSIMVDRRSPDVCPLVLQGRRHHAWLEYLNDDDPVLAAMALEAKNTPAKVTASRRNSDVLIDKAKKRNERRRVKIEALSSDLRAAYIQRKQESQARYRSSRREQLAENERLRRQKKKRERVAKA